MLFIWILVQPKVFSVFEMRKLKFREVNLLIKSCNAKEETEIVEWQSYTKM